MRARAGLAAALDALGKVDDAVNHYRDMLELNPNDNQGLRYVLAGCLMRSGEIEALKKLLKKFDDGSALWLYNQVLIAFRANGGTDKKTEDLARRAWNANRHVPAALTGMKKVPASPDGYITVGGEDEAAYYVEECGSGWRTTPGAVDWLVRLTAENATTRKERPFLH